MCTQVVHDQILTLLADAAVRFNAVQQIGRTNVRCHDQNRILEVYGSALRIGDTSVIKYLKQYVKDIRMCFLDLIKQYNRIWFSSYCLGQLSAFLITYISWRSSDQTGHRIFLHVLTHIDTHHILLIIKHARCQCFCKLRLTDTGRSKEEKGTNRLGRIFDTGFGTDDRIGHFSDTLFLSDDTFVQLVIQMQDLATLTFRQFCNRNTGPSGNDPCDLFVGYTVMHQRQVFAFDLFFFDFQLFLKFRQFAVLQFCCLVQIIASLCLLDLFVHIFNLFTQHR